MSKTEGYWFWEISIDTSKAALGRLGEALLRTGAGLECGPMSRLIHGFPLGRGISAGLVVQIPEGKEDEFREVCKPHTILPNPPLVQIAGLRMPDDGHPGRNR